MNEPRFLTVDTTDLVDGAVLAYEAATHKIVGVSSVGGGGGILLGTGVPGGGLGSDGAVYIRTNTGDIYQKDGSDWELQGNIKGPQGIPGTNGTSTPGPVGPVGPVGPAAPDMRRYNQEPLELVNGVRTVFTLPDNFVAGSTAVFRGMARLKLGPGNDYVEVEPTPPNTVPNQIELALVPPAGTAIVCDYTEAT